MNIGQLIATLGVDDTGLLEAQRHYQQFAKDVDDRTRMISKSLEQTGSAMKKMGRNLSLYVTAPLVAAGVFAFKSASDMVESINKVDVAFGDNAKQVKKWSETTLGSIGLAQQSALDMAALYGDMSTSMGFTTKQAADMSTRLVRLAGDLSSFKNIQIGVAQTALSGVFTGETESLKRLGIVMTQVNLQEYALQQGISKRVNKMTQAEKVQLRYNYILNVTKNSQGDFSRTSDSAANQLRLFKESVKEVSETFGNVMLPVITPVIKRLNEFLNEIKGLSEEKRKWIIRIGAVAAALGPLLTVLGFFVGNVIPGLVKTVGFAIKAFKALTLAMITNPMIAVASALAGLTTAFLVFRKRNEEAVESQKDFNKELLKTEQIANRQKIQQFIRDLGLLKEQTVKAGGHSATFEAFDVTKLSRLSEVLSELPLDYLRGVRELIAGEVIELQRKISVFATKGKTLFTATYSKDLRNLQEVLKAVNLELEKSSKITPFGMKEGVDYKKNLEQYALALQNINESAVPVFEAFPDYRRFFMLTAESANELSLQLEQVAMKAEFLGQDRLGAQLQYLQARFEELWNSGVRPGEERLDAIIERMGKLNKTQLVIGALSRSMADLFVTIGKSLGGSTSAFESFADSVLSTAQTVITALLTEAIAGIIAGETITKGVIGLATAAVGIGVLTALWGRYKSQASDAAQLAGGGVVPPGYPNDSYPAMLSSKEMVVPPQKLPDFAGGQFGDQENMDKLIKVIEDKESVEFNIDNGGIAVIARKGLSRTEYINRKFNRKV